MDVLTDVLETIRVRAACYGRVEASGAWGIDVAASDEAKFHIVLSGTCWLRVQDEELIELGPGDLAALPHGTAHSIVDDPKTEPIALEGLLAQRAEGETVLRIGGSG